jgi:hypothetical protein
MLDILNTEYQESLERRRDLGLDEIKVPGARLDTLSILYNSISNKVASKYVLDGVVPMANLVGICGSNSQLSSFESQFNEHIKLKFTDISVVAGKLIDGLKNGENFILKPAKDSALGDGVIILTPSLNRDINAICIPYGSQQNTGEPLYEPWHAVLENFKNSHYLGNGYSSYNINPKHLGALLYSYSTENYPNPYLIAEEYITNRLLTPTKNVVELRYQFDIRYGTEKKSLKPNLIKVGANKYFGTVSFLKNKGAHTIYKDADMNEFFKSNLQGYDNEETNEIVRNMIRKYFSLFEAIGFSKEEDIINFTFDFCFVRKGNKIAPVFIENHIRSTLPSDAEL